MTFLTRWLQGTTRTSRKATHHLRSAMESLEDRALPATGVTATFASGILNIQGTNKADKIYVEPINGFIYVTDEFTGQYVKINNGPTSVRAASVKKVEVYAKGGDDLIALNTDKGQVDADAYLNGGTGKDTFFGGKRFNQYHEDSYAVVMHGTSATDVQQEGSPTCQTLASLAEMASQGQNPAANISSKTRGYYHVKLPGANTTQTVYFMGTWTDNDPTPVADGTTREVWPLLMQRARLQSLGVKYDTFKTDANWEADNKKTNNRLFSTSDALKTFSGRTVSTSKIGSISAKSMQASIRRGDDVVLGSLPGSKKKDLTADGIAHNHAYAVLSVFQQNGKWMVSLYNPWATDRNDGQRIGPPRSSGAAADDGIITLEWAAVQRSFANVYTAKK